MTAADKEFNDFIMNEIASNLGITVDDYRALIFKAGIRAKENNSKYKSYFTSTGAFWDCFSHHVNFINFQIITQDKFYESLNYKERTIDSVKDYFEWITQTFELPKRAVNLINKQYRIDFENSQIIKNSDLKPLKQQRQPRTSRKVNNQAEINLNTI